MSFTLTFVVGTVGSFAAIAAAVFWWRASRIHIPDDIDNVIGVLQRVSRLNAYGARAASVAALCGLLVLWFGRQVTYLILIRKPHRSKLEMLGAHRRKDRANGRR